MQKKNTWGCPCRNSGESPSILCKSEVEQMLIEPFSRERIIACKFFHKNIITYACKLQERMTKNIWSMITSEFHQLMSIGEYSEISLLRAGQTLCFTFVSNGLWISNFGWDCNGQILKHLRLGKCHTDTLPFTWRHARREPFGEETAFVITVWKNNIISM